MDDQPELYRALDWWKENIGFTNPNWNLLFFRIYAAWFTNSLDQKSNAPIKADSLGSDFINDVNQTILSFRLDYVEETNLSPWSYDLSFVLTCFYFLHPYHEHASQYF